MAESGRKTTRAEVSKVRLGPRRGARQKARAAIRDLAERTLVLEPMQPGASRYALAYLASLSPRHLMYPSRDPADQAKIAYAQADMMVGVITAVLDGLGLSDADWQRGSDIASEALRACSTQGWEP